MNENENTNDDKGACEDGTHQYCECDVKSPLNHRVGSLSKPKV